MKQFLKLLFIPVTCLLFSVYVNAQVTKTLNGTVRYESGMSETKFSTPNGNVVMKLPQSMSGTTITGTVSAEPAGKTEKEKNKNLEQLLKFTVNLDGQKIPVSSTPANFNWLTHPGNSSGTPMELLNASGTQVAKVSLPPVLPGPVIVPSGNALPLSTPSKVLVKGDLLNVYTTRQFSPGEKFILTDSKGHEFTLKPICLSSEQAVMSIPEEAVPGKYTVSQEVKTDPLTLYRAPGKAKFNLIDINLTSPNTNLRPGQQSNVLVTVYTDMAGPAQPLNEVVGPPVGEDDWQPTNPLSIDLRNLNPNTVTMEGGNLQRIKVNPSRKTLVSGEQTAIWFQLDRKITGNAVGNFSVSATLHDDFSSSNDPFRPQLNILQTPEDFNAWATALKKDLEAYAGIQTNDGPGHAIKTNTERAIDNIPVCSDPGQLDECKAVIYSLIHPLDVPKAAANTWLSNYEAFKTAAKVIHENVAGNTGLIDLDMIRNGLAYTSKTADKQLIDHVQVKAITEAEGLVGQIETQTETKETLQKLDQALGTLNIQMSKTQSGMPEAMKMLLPGGLLFLVKFPPPKDAPVRPVDVNDIYWGKLPSDDTKDVININVHYTGDISVEKLIIRVKYVSKDGKRSGDADLEWPVKKPSNYEKCQKIPMAMVWPDDFKSPTGGMLLPKNELDLNKTKVAVIVNGANTGEGKPDEGKPKDGK